MALVANPDDTLALAVLVYKAFTLLIGLMVVYFGYQLFQSGVFGASGDIEAVFKNNKLLVKRAAPGTIFAIAGAIIISIGMFKGVSIPTFFGEIEAQQAPEPTGGGGNQ